ncbi:MAG: C39 family peptidase [Chloroflexota bacterium]
MFGAHKTKRRRFIVLVAIIAVELFLIGTALLARPVLQQVPGRYASRLPSFLQQLALPEHDKRLPTPIVVVTMAPPTMIGEVQTGTSNISVPTATAIAQPPTREVHETDELVLTATTAPQATPSAVPTVDTVEPIAAVASISGVPHIYQLWNNCGPANLTMVMNYHGWSGSQVDAAARLKPNPEDKNVSPEEMAAFVNENGLKAYMRRGGDLSLIKRLVHAGFPVLVEKGFDPEPERLGWMGHYLVITGYDDLSQEFTTMDSYLGPGMKETYANLDYYWRHFNRTYIVVSRSEDEKEIVELLGTDADLVVNSWNTLQRAIEEVNALPEDPFAWLNLGSAYLALDFIEDAASSYDQARLLNPPWRITWYRFGVFEAYLEVGRFQEVKVLALDTIEATTDVEEVYYYLGLARREEGDIVGAKEALGIAEDLNPYFMPATIALATLQ